MNNRNNSGSVVFVGQRGVGPNVEVIHESWLALIRYCTNLQHGEIERLKIQDGLPVLAEVIKEKIKFTR